MSLLQDTAHEILCSFTQNTKNKGHLADVDTMPGSTLDTGGERHSPIVKGERQCNQ